MPAYCRLYVIIKIYTKLRCKIRMWGSHMNARYTIPYLTLLAAEVQCKTRNEAPAADRLHSVRNANERCKLRGRWALQMKPAAHMSRVPIMVVLLLPSGHRWPFDPGRGLNVRGHASGSKGTTARPWPGMDHYGNGTHYRRRDGGGMHSVCYNHAKGNTHKDKHHICAFFS